MITVLQPGLLSTIQDDGRQDYLAFGLPRAGVMDRYASRMANLLCGNPFSAAVIEMTIMGGAFSFERPCRIALCGADMGPRLNGAAIDNWTAVEVSKGDLLETSYATSGCRSYLAVSGGFNVPVVMGSRSTYIRAAIGGVEGRALRKNDRIPLGEMPPLPTGPRRLDPIFIPEYTDKIRLRIMLGPQEDLFHEDGIKTFLQGEYRVTDEADRMGYRLEGPAIRHLDKADIVSDALGRGAVQVPGSGQPIVMMSDCGTTGGYAKIATVIGADLWKLAQARPQDSVRFSRCTDQEAVAALLEEKERYRLVAQRLADPAVADASAKTDKCRMHLSINQQKYQIEIEEVK